VAAASSAAAKHPETNEDSYLIDDAAGVLAVFDGIGGGGDGDLCSAAARDAVAEETASLPAETDLRGRRDWLRRVIGEAAFAVRRVRKWEGQGTTAVVGVRCEDVLLFASVGDSRAYRFNQASGLELLSRDDDSFSGPAAEEARRQCDEAVDLSELQGLARKMFRHRNVLGRELGMVHDHDTGIDGVQLERDDVIVFTSDGVHDNLTATEIEELIRDNAAAGPEAVAEALRRSARDRANDPSHARAKDDDITAVALSFG
jgi:protein phosphatase